jgi:spore coat protein JB
LPTLGFAMQEIALYLDTHRDDKEALDLYRSLQRLYHQGKEIYERMYGPLNHMSMTEGEYKWLDDPWPWEYAANREV